MFFFCNCNIVKVYLFKHMMKKKSFTIYGAKLLNKIPIVDIMNAHFIALKNLSFDAGSSFVN